MVRPHRDREGGDRDRRIDQRLVPEDRLAAEHREDLGHDAEERQGDDVDLGVPEEPEQVLPEDDAAVGGVVDVRPKTRSAAAARIAAASTGNAMSTRIDVTSVFQVKIGIRNIVMPGARIVMIVVMKFGAEDGAEAREAEAEHPEVAADTGRERRRRQRLIGEPSEGCRALR